MTIGTDRAFIAKNGITANGVFVANSTITQGNGFFINSTGVFACGVVNAASYNSINGSNTFIANSTGITVGNTTVNVSINSTSFSGTSLTSNNAIYLDGLPGTAYKNNLVDIIYTSNNTWVCPSGVTTVRVTVIGSGGGGGIYSYGGDGGSAMGVYTVTPGTTYYIYVGSAGDGNIGNAQGTGGGLASFGTYSGPAFISATGGAPGLINSSIPCCTNPINYPSGASGSGAGGTIINQSSALISPWISFSSTTWPGTGITAVYKRNSNHANTLWSLSYSPGVGGDSGANGTGGVGGLVRLEYIQ